MHAQENNLFPQEYNCSGTEYSICSSFQFLSVLLCLFCTSRKRCKMACHFSNCRILKYFVVVQPRAGLGRCNILHENCSNVSANHDRWIPLTIISYLHQLLNKCLFKVCLTEKQSTSTCGALLSPWDRQRLLTPI